MPRLENWKLLISPTGYANSIIAGTWKDATNIDINKFGTRLELSDTKLEFYTEAVLRLVVMSCIHQRMLKSQ